MRLGETWASLRSPLRETFSFAEIKDICGAAGLPIHELGHLQQRSGGNVSKGQLIDAIDLLFRRKAPEEQDRIVVHVIREMVRRIHYDEHRSSFTNQLSEVLGRVGWGLANDEPYPLALQIGVDTTQIDTSLRDAINTSLRRFRDGDHDGALTAICGAVDTLTAQIYSRYPDLGDHRRTPYAVRVRNAFSKCHEQFRSQFEAEFGEDFAEQLWGHQSKSIEQAGEVLAKLRQLSDAHGEQRPPILAVQQAIDCAVYVTRIFAGVAN